MSVELGTGYVSIVPSARGFGAALNREIGPDLHRVGSDGGDQASRGFIDRFRTGLGGLAVHVGAAFAAIGIGRLAGAALEIAGDYQQTVVAFEGVLGSAEDAQRAIGELREFAARTPFEFPGLAETSLRLLGVGFAAEELLPIMGTIGDVTAALGQGPEAINGVVRALGQMRGRGKVTAEELNQISDAIPGFSAIAAIAEGVGVTTSEAFAMVTAGAVDADTGIRLILDGMQRFPGAAGAMERQSRTLNGVISTFKDTLATAAIDFITPHLPAITRAIQSLGQWITTTAVPALQDFLAAVQPIASFIADNLTPVLIGLGTIIGIGLVAALAALVTPVSAVVVGLGLLAAGIAYAWQHSETFRDIVTGVVGVVAAVIGGFVAVITDLWKRFGDDIVQFATDAWDAIKQIVEGTLAVITGIFDFFKAVFTGKWGEAWEAIKQILGGVWDAMHGIVDLAFAALRGIIEVGLGLISAAWHWAWEGIKNFLSNTWESIKTGTSTAIGEVVEFFRELPGRIVDIVTGTLGRLEELGRAIVRAIVRGITSVAGSIGNAIRDAIPGSGLIPGLPGFASGGVMSGGGVVGETGREFMYSLGRNVVVPTHKLMDLSVVRYGATNEELALLREQNARLAESNGLLAAIVSNTHDNSRQLLRAAGVY